MPRKPRDATIKPSMGGRLMSALSLENIGPADYSEKVNYRRKSFDHEGRREGYVKFAPMSGVADTAQYNPGIGDITLIDEVVRPNGQTAVIAASNTAIAWFDSASGSWNTLTTGITYNDKAWESVPLAGYLILNNGWELPYVLNFNTAGDAIVLSRLYELRESGIASAGTIAEHNGILILGNIREIQTAELNGIMNGADPYGPVPDAQVNQVQYRLMWSEYGNPLQYALLLSGTIQQANKDQVELPYPVHSDTWDVGDLMGVSGAGPGMGMLGGQQGIEDGNPITGVAGNVITLQEPASSAIPNSEYPLDVTITRFADISSLVGYSDLQDDGSAITKMRGLGKHLVVYRDTRIFLGRYTGDADAPFDFTRGYIGRNVPYYEDSLVDVRGQYHLYATPNGYYKYYGVDEPQKEEVLTQCENYFYDNTEPSDAALLHGRDNPMTGEVFLSNPAGVLAMDYKFHTVSWIDETYDSFGYVAKPGASDNERWFLLSKSGKIYRYGLGPGFETFLRDGAAAASSLKYGYWNGGNEYNEFDLVAYIPVLASGSVDIDMEIRVWGAKNPASAPELFFMKELSAPVSRNLIPCLFRCVYFQDEISIVGIQDTDAKISSKMFKIANIGGDGVTRV